MSNILDINKSFLTMTLEQIPKYLSEDWKNNIILIFSYLLYIIKIAQSTSISDIHNRLTMNQDYQSIGSKTIERYNLDLDQLKVKYMEVWSDFDKTNQEIINNYSKIIDPDSIITIQTIILELMTYIEDNGIIDLAIRVSNTFSSGSSKEVLTKLDKLSNNIFTIITMQERKRQLYTWIKEIILNQGLSCKDLTSKSLFQYIDLITDKVLSSKFKRYGIIIRSLIAEDFINIELYNELLDIEDNIKVLTGKTLNLNQLNLLSIFKSWYYVNHVSWSRRAFLVDLITVKLVSFTKIIVFVLR